MQAGQRDRGGAAGHRDIPDPGPASPRQAGPAGLPELDEVSQDGGVTVIGGVPGHPGRPRAHIPHKHSSWWLRRL